MNEFSRDEFVAFFGRHGGTPCEACGIAAGWILPEAEKDYTVGLFNPRPEDGGYVMPSGLVPAVVMVCKNCGNMRLYSKIFVAQKIKEAKGDGRK